MPIFRRETRVWFFLAVSLSTVLAVYFLSPMLAPFIFGALLAYLGDPLVDQLERLKLSRSAAVSLVFLAIFVVIGLLVLLLVPMLHNQLDALTQRAPEYGEWLDDTATQIASYFGVDADAINFKDVAKTYLPEAGSATKGLLEAVFKSGSALLSGVVFVTLTPVITFYLMRDWDLLVARLYELIPHALKAKVKELATESDSMVSAFLRGQFLVMTGLGTIYAFGLSIIGLQFSLLVGLVAGIMSFIPYLGTAVGVILAGVLFVAQYQDWVALWKVALVFGIGQLIEGYLLTPWLVGDRIGLHPVAVIFAVLAGGHLFGFVGVLLALPVSAVLAVLIRHAVGHYKESELFNDGNEQSVNPDA
ncbi:AI-2E family transporter [Arenicella chitinivorans]|uniref:AI-2E family transporter n=1 Tax=Arenicella chitinivorans TaxID=1329800 RepID=A0A918RL83_9GAMM|nr:AI-2E family transporter [Arenicella chitinivorans]GHA01420.1 AI-2E family transporter [Arenicella chitinivorans]